MRETQRGSPQASEGERGRKAEMAGRITSGRVQENKAAIDNNWDRIFTDNRPECACGAPLKRHEVGRCSACIAGTGRPDA